LHAEHRTLPRSALAPVDCSSLSASPMVRRVILRSREVYITGVGVTCGGRRPVTSRRAERDGARLTTGDRHLRICCRDTSWVARHTGGPSRSRGWGGTSLTATTRSGSGGVASARRRAGRRRTAWLHTGAPSRGRSNRTLRTGRRYRREIPPDGARLTDGGRRRRYRAGVERNAHVAPSVPNGRVFRRRLHRRAHRCDGRRHPPS
jgi:hypothetical protein